MSTPFIKAQATGNDFIFINKDQLRFPLAPEKIEKLCSRRFGVGADGLVVMDYSTESCDFIWDFYNSDGGSAEMCGNAARAATLIATTSERAGLKAEVIFKTRVGLVRGRKISPQETEVSWTAPALSITEIANPCGGLAPKGYLINTGVPHCVIPVEDPWGLEKARRSDLAKYIFSPEFGKNGANLTFVNWQDPQKIKAVTLERGVNDFTLSCGTGVIAVAAAYDQIMKSSGEKKVSTPGGDLRVQVSEGMVILSGPAQIVFKGEL